MNCKIHPILYKYYLGLRKQLGAQIVHRRKRQNDTCIEIIFLVDALGTLRQHLNTLKEAEQCGYWVICRPQNKRGHTVYKGYRVHQLFLSPVHPKKRRRVMPIMLGSVAPAHRSQRVAAAG